MKQHLLLTTIALALSINSSAFALQEAAKCSSVVNCAYDANTYVNQSSGSNTTTQTQSQCIESYTSTCWRYDQGKCVYYQDNGYLADRITASCNSICEKMGYDVYVYTNNAEFGCACENKPDGGWESTSVSREQYYSYTYNTNIPCKTRTGKTATSQYRCKPGYYGVAAGTCIACPENAICEGGSDTTFICDSRYYKNGSKCTACPDSAAGGLGTLVRTNKGATADTYDTGATSITECYIDGLTSYYEDPFKDSTGTFILGGECYYKQ